MEPRVPGTGEGPSFFPISAHALSASSLGNKVIAFLSQAWHAASCVFSISSQESFFGGENGRQGEGWQAGSKCHGEGNGHGAGTVVRWRGSNVITLSALETRGLMTQMSDTQPYLDSDIGDRQVSVTETTSVTG